MPINAQMKDTDLVLINIENKKVIKIQVKGSRAYEPKKSEILKYEDGSAGWFYLKKETIYKNTADYFIFLIYVLEENKKTGRRLIAPHTLTIPKNELIDFCDTYKKVGKGDKYNFFFWINPEEKISFEFKDQISDVTKYLDGNGLHNLNQELK